jgi:hypothetical protein
MDVSAQGLARAIVDQVRDPFRPPPVELPTWDDCARQLNDLFEDVIGELTCAS